MDLGARLKAAADFVKPGGSVADIGTDHAYLPIYLVERGIVEKAFACDVSDGPCEAARRSIAAAGLGRQIAVRCGDGLATLAPGEVQTAILAGMGGITMLEILRRQPAVVASLRALVLQPMNAAAQLRIWLNGHGWRIALETLVLEEGRLYEVLRAEPGEAEIIEPILYEIGPRLWEARHPLLRAHVSRLLEQAERVLTAMSASERAKRTEKYAQAMQRARDLKERVACL